jgi:hypothetical protein
MTTYSLDVSAWHYQDVKSGFIIDNNGTSADVMRVENKPPWLCQDNTRCVNPAEGIYRFANDDDEYAWVMCEVCAKEYGGPDVVVKIDGVADFIIHVLDQAFSEGVTS